MIYNPIREYIAKEFPDTEIPTDRLLEFKLIIKSKDGEIIKVLEDTL